MEKKINVSISEGDPFFAHEASINFNPTQFILDFRTVTPRVDPRVNEAPVIHIKHNIVMVDAFHAKKVHELLGNMIKKYENEFGKIEVPEAMKKAEKRRKSEKKKAEADTTNTAPDYFG